MSIPATIQSYPAAGTMGTFGYPHSLLILGAGGHGCVVAELARACGYSRVDFADDAAPGAVCTLSGLPSVAARYDAMTVSVGNLSMRKDLFARIETLAVPCPPLVSPNAFVSPSAQIGPGALVLPGAIVHTNAVVGIGAIISAGAVIDHDAVVGPCAHVDAGAVVAARASVSPLTKVPAGTCVRPDSPINAGGGTK